VKIFRDCASFLEFTKSQTETIGFVPTMGALHEGHISLMTRAKQENKILIVSIFVNPTQFLPNEDLSKYPRREEADIKICELAGIDALFLPNIDEMYNQDDPKVCAPNIRGFILEGFQRPGHYDGVLTIVLKLLMLTNATNAYFGQKDAQQLILIEEMVRRFYLPVKIVPCPTARDDDGLALSSRNIYLSAEQKIEALKLSKSLFCGAKLIANGLRNCKHIKEQMLKELLPLSVDYLEITDYELNIKDELVLSNTLLLVAARVGSVRLIDNLWI
jgi:pantoate--beta-alanine ligase